MGGGGEVRFVTGVKSLPTTDARLGFWPQIVGVQGLVRLGGTRQEASWWDGVGFRGAGNARKLLLEAPLSVAAAQGATPLLPLPLFIPVHFPPPSNKKKKGEHTG